MSKLKYQVTNIIVVFKGWIERAVDFECKKIKRDTHVSKVPVSSVLGADRLKIGSLSFLFSFYSQSQRFYTPENSLFETEHNFQISIFGFHVNFPGCI